MTIHPYIIGSGSSGRAIAKSLAVLGVLNADWKIASPIQLSRTTDWTALEPPEGAILFIASPHGLHAEAIVQGERAGFRSIVTEKPACVSRQDIARLREVRA